LVFSAKHKSIGPKKFEWLPKSENGVVVEDEKEHRIEVDRDLVDSGIIVVLLLLQC